MTAASKINPLLKLHCREFLVCRTSQSYRKANAFREETGKCNGKTLRGKGPSTYVKITEITSGRANSQQGRAATCKDL
jgi:hypothetical protein